MNGRLRRRIFLVFLGVTLAPAALYAGDGPCGGIGQRACCFFGDGRNCVFEGGCDDGLIEVGVPFCGVAGNSTPSCGGCSSSWCAEETLCGGDLERACCGGQACEAGLIQDLTPEGECHERLDPEFCVCGGGAFLSAGICREPKNVGEQCNAFTPCADNLVCLILSLGESRCYPEHDENGYDDDVCAALYNSGIHEFAIAQQTTLTFGTGVGAAAGISGAIEVGVVYGRDGSYGCYRSACVGLEADISIGTYIVEGIFDLDFDGIAGDSEVNCLLGLCTVFVDGVGIVGTVTEIEGLGAGFNPLSVNSFSACNTVTNLIRCRTASGAIERIIEDVTECNAIPSCDAGGDTIAQTSGGPVAVYDAGCAGDPVSIELDGTGSRDADGTPLTYFWSTSCPGLFDGSPFSSSEAPTLTQPDGFVASCFVFLLVSDGVNESACNAPVVVGSPKELLQNLEVEQR